ncbi:MAG: hypothetical protein KA954_01220 [Chitinophagales bacterium]|nr:hypothetical protein [Chitinophagales bacterium]
MHIYGEGLKEEISTIDGHEKPELYEIRKKYAKSNRDLFARESRPIDKIFSARGGSVYYNMSDSLNKKAAVIANNIKDGLSVRKWNENKWKPHFLDDPNGMIYMEIGNSNGTMVAYPTYKSISVVYDYLPVGVNLEYIVFHVSAAEKEKAGFKKEDKIYRVVDDAFDYWVKAIDNEISILEQHTFPNYFGHVPAILNSDFLSPEYPGLALSLFNDVIELADDFIQTGSIRNLAKLRMAYPKYWEYADDCPVCKGEKVSNGAKCEPCKGTGKKLMLNPGDAKLLLYPDGKDTPIVTPNVAGFVPFPKDYFDHATADLSDLENIISVTIWGVESRKNTTGLSADGEKTKTATEVIDDMQPKADRLYAISDMAEKRHKFIIDHAIQFSINNAYSGSSINYGRRYLIEGPDTIWNRYSQARKEGASISILDDLLMDYIETKYSGDPISMNIQLKLLTVEPFVHSTVAEIKSLNPSFQEYIKKLYFSEWLATVNDGALLTQSVDELKAALQKYVDDKKIIEPKPVPAAA